jgi:hypothetical protein
MLFCILEKDEKTFKYLKEYLDFLDDKKISKNIFFLDNKIQHEELNTHLYHQEINPFEDSNKKDCELESWITKNAKQFRQYLSSIKLLAYAAYNKGFHKGNDITYQNFSELCDTFNNLKDILIDHIF